MNHKQLKVLLVIEQCNPEWASVPLVGYRFYQELSQLTDTTLVTHERNEKALQKIQGDRKIVYLKESELTQKYYKLIAKLTKIKGRTNWQLLHTLSYPIYAEFDSQVYSQFQDSVRQGDYDIVHAITPMMPRYPYKIVNACQNIPFLIGPVNGGVPFPPGFQEVAKQEFAYLNFLRAVGRYFIPGYINTYREADKILAGSTYTFNLLKRVFRLSEDKIELLYENGISQDFLNSRKENAFKDYPKNKAKLNLLFVGRLVPYKGTDFLIEAVHQLESQIPNKIELTIVGDGSEKETLEKQVKEYKLEHIVHFTGWVEQQKTLDYYQQADIFCFPSVREFGGAVVIEAMACGLPCIVVNNGGIGEYVTSETGFSIEPISQEYVIKDLVKKINLLTEKDDLRKQMSVKARERSKDFLWENKAKAILRNYEELIFQNNYDQVN